MRICILQPDYSASNVDYKNYDPSRDLGHLLPGDHVDHVLINKLTTYKQLKALAGEGYDIFVNLCEGYLDWDIPSIDVVYFLETLNLPHTGPSTLLYDPSKELMKYVAYVAKVTTPSFVVLHPTDNIEDKIAGMNYPLFIKPAHAGDSLGIDKNSLIRSLPDLQQKAASLFEEFGSLMVEEYIAGREFSVLVAANADGRSVTAFKPVEYRFPDGYEFKSYDLKTSVLSTNANMPCEAQYESQLKEMSIRIFKGFSGLGYARLDFRLDAAGQFHFLEINFACSVFYQGMYKGTADYIVDFDGVGQAGFLKHIIDEGIGRFRRKEQLYARKGNSISGYGIYATRNISPGEIVFRGEERPQRLVTKKWISENWSEEDRDVFAHYGVPVTDEVYMLWSEDPNDWAPQNHSCAPNTEYIGLNVHARRFIPEGEELTLDYALILDETIKPFDCLCNSPNCRKVIRGMKKINGQLNYPA